jgi:hypothetical protein
VLLPNDSESYYVTRNLVPHDLLPEMNKAKIVITIYHAFKLRDNFDAATGTRRALEGHGPELNTAETEGQMLQRVMGDLMGMKDVVVINDEAHHCYRERPVSEEQKLTGDERKEADENREAARLWISGLEALNRHQGVKVVYDLSATPFFLSGSGWLEGTLFPWVMTDFSLMDAIECGIVKLPRVPPQRAPPLHRSNRRCFHWPSGCARAPTSAIGKARARRCWVSNDRCGLVSTMEPPLKRWAASGRSPHRLKSEGMRHKRPYATRGSRPPPRGCRSGTSPRFSRQTTPKLQAPRVPRATSCRR